MGCVSEDAFLSHQAKQHRDRWEHHPAGGSQGSEVPLGLSWGEVAGRPLLAAGIKE